MRAGSAIMQQMSRGGSLGCDDVSGIRQRLGTRPCDNQQCGGDDRWLEGHEVGLRGCDGCFGLVVE